MSIEPNANQFYDNLAKQLSDQQPKGGQMWGTGPAPSMVEHPLPPNDPWVIAMVNMFHIPLPEAQLYAGRFRDNMFQWLNNQIKHDMEKQKQAAQEFKKSIDE